MTHTNIRAWPHTAAILAGGQSSRMGQPKHARRLPDGRMMIEYVAAMLEDFSRQIVILGVIEELPQYQHLPDLSSGIGPLGGLESLLASGLDDEYLVVTCDMPLVTADLLVQLTKPNHRLAAVFQKPDRDRPEPFPLRISSDALSLVQNQIQQRNLSMGGVLEKMKPSVFKVDRGQADRLLNVNTPEEWDALQDHNIS